VLLIPYRGSSRELTDLAAPDCADEAKGFLADRALRRERMTRAETIGHLIDLFTPEECANYFVAAGYKPE
jgi:hypothetical protein